jgi:predicted AAA+ superfamily ATPase
MVLITGPRQVGKTHLAKEIMKKYQHPAYFNFDDIDDMKTIKDRSWFQGTDLIVLDEIHKMKDWKTFLKGTYDTRKEQHHFLVTGSARLDTFRQTGESLAGRYFSYRLNPLSVKELEETLPPYEALSLLNKLGGFPEPFLSGSETLAQRWRKQYHDDLVREDILDFSRITEINSIKNLQTMLRRRVGNPISYSSLAQDLQIAPNTVRKYLDILESLHIIFLVRPFHKNIARAILKEPKIYFFDTGFVEGNEGVKLENSVAVCLLKHAQFIQDTEGLEAGLFYIRTKEQREIDFALGDGKGLKTLIEVKLSDHQESPHLRYFKERNPTLEAVQLVHNLHNEQTKNGISVVRAGEWLKTLKA